jgi:hypothetical protein
MHLNFHHVRVSAMIRKDDGNNIDASVKTNQIDNNGIVHLDNGVKLELSQCKLIPPESNDYVNVVMMFSLENMYDPIIKCPNCESTIPWDRPILLMDNMQFVYPCSDCEWVWERQSFNMRKFRSENR